MRNNRLRLTTAALWFGLMLAPAVPLPADAGTVPWKRDTFGSSYDGPLTPLLKTIIGAGGLNAVIKVDSTKSVSYKFDNVLPEEAFNKVVAENELSWDYDESTRTVTVSLASKESVKYVSLKYATPEQVREAIKQLSDQGFVIGGSFYFEQKSGLAVLKGNASQLEGLQQLIGRLEEGEKARQDNRSDQMTKGAQAQREAAEAERVQVETQLKREKADQERRAQLEIENISVKVIPLHYASVGPVKIKFQGEDVTVPGLIDSLNVLLGVSPTQLAQQAAESAQARTEQSLLTTNGNGQLAGAAATQQQPTVVRRDLNQFRGTVSPDTRTNSVVVRGTPKEVAQVEELVVKLDKPLEQIEIEAMIVLAQKGVSEQLGLRWGGEQAGSAGGNQYGSALIGPGFGGGGDKLYDINGMGTAGSGGQTLKTSDMQPLVSPLSLMPTTSSGTVANFIFRGARSALKAQINALSNDAKAQVLTSPRVVTLDNLAAKITDDRTSYIPTTAGANSSGSYLQVNAGLTLKITPSLLRRDDLGEDNMVRMVIEAENTSVGAGSVAGTVSRSGNQVQTQVVIPDGATFVMGGLVSDSRTESREGIPLLQDIPVLGALFTVRDSEHSQQEVLFFITPRVVARSELYARDVAQKRYLQQQRSELAGVARDVRDNSQLIRLRTKAADEDE